MIEQILLEKNPGEDDSLGVWRLHRVKKLVQVFGVEWFKNKKILELGCASGNIGLALQALGADVTFADARCENLESVIRKKSNVKTVLINQEQEWSINTKFDLIIHFSVLYNIKNWKQDIKCTLSQGRYVALETAVAKYDTKFETLIYEAVYSNLPNYGSYSGTGSLVSSSSIEEVILNNGSTYMRYDDADISLSRRTFRYDWEESSSHNITNEHIMNSWWDNPHFGGRRFWIINNKQVTV